MNKMHEQAVSEITINRSTKVKGEFVERGAVLTIGKDIEKNDARFLLRTGRALPGKQTRIMQEVAVGKKSTEAAEKKAKQALEAKLADEKKAKQALEAKLADEKKAKQALEAKLAEAENRAAQAEKELVAMKDDK